MKLFLKIYIHIFFVLQHPDLTVTSEERFLNSILMWCMKAKELSQWEMVDDLMTKLTPEQLFEERLPSVNELLPFVRFPLLPYGLLKKVCKAWMKICASLLRI